MVERLGMDEQEVRGHPFFTEWAAPAGLFDVAATTPYERVLAEEVRREFGQPGADAGGVGRQVRRPERADLAPADQTRVGLDPHDGAVEDGDGVPAGPLVRPLVEGQPDLVRRHPRDAHPPPPLWSRGSGI